MGKIIEFCGLPGSGKSTLASLVLSDVKNYCNEREFYANLTGKKSIFPTISYLLVPIHLKFKFLSFKLFLICRNKKVFKSILKIIRFSMIINKNDNNYILSEGVVQNVFELLEKCDNEKQYRVVFKILDTFLNIHKNIMIVFLDVEENKSFERIRMRNSIPNSIDLLDDTSLKQLLHKRKLLEKEVIDTIKNRNFVIIDSNINNIDNIKNNILMEIKKYL